MIRVLHVIGGMDSGGAETLIMNLYRNLNREEIQFDFLVHTSKECFYDKEIHSLGGRIYRVEKYNIINMLSYYKSIDKFMRSHPEIKIVHGHINSSAFIYLRIANKYNKRTVLHCHATKRTDKSIKAIAFEVSARLARSIPDYYLSCSQKAGESRFGERVTKGSRFDVLENGINVSKFKYNAIVREKIRVDNGIDNNQVIIGHVGRFTLAKNHTFLINVFEHYHNDNPKSELWLIGDGELKNAIIKYANLSDCPNSIHFLGIKNNVNEFLQGMDAFIFPSLFEGLGISLIEAQAAGLPCLVSNNIQNEADMCAGLLNVLPLELGPVKWAHKLEELTANISRKDTSNYITKAGFDIVSSTNKLVNIYYGLV